MYQRTFFTWVIGLLLSVTLSAQTGIWQWSVPVRNFSSQSKHPNSRAYLWIPEHCVQVKAILIAQHNMEEISILEDSMFRQRMSELDVAQVWVCPSFNHGFDFRDGAWETLDGLLADLAAVSGYQEVATAPLIALGHSAAASWPYYLAAYQPERTLACISVSGQWPYHRDEWLCPDSWGERHLNTIPCLETMGEYESAHTWSNEGLKERSEHPLLPLSMLACPAEGHFAYTSEKAQYIALYIRKALQYGHVDPTRTGWLSERWKVDEEPSVAPAPVASYSGNPREAFWFFDREMVEATQAYQARHRRKLPQLVSVAQEGKVVRQRNTHLQVHPAFCPEEDGLTFQLTPVFLDTVPGESPRLAKWTGLPVGSSIGHAKGSPSIAMITGPAVLRDSVTFRVAWNRGTLWTDEKADIVFAVTHPGDNSYKPAVQQAQLTIPVRYQEGEVQHISFTELPDIQRGTCSIPLFAEASSGLPVGFYVESGPAYVENNRLVFTPIPPRTSYPIAVTVIAWQYGRKEPTPIQTAEPVRRTFYIK